MADIVSDLELYLPLDDDASDASGNGWNGTLVNSASLTTGKIGNALAAVSASQKKLVGGNFTGISNVGEFTIGGWVYPTAHNNYRMIWAQQVSNSIGIELGMSGPGQGDGDANTGIAFTISGASAARIWTAANTLPLNEWSHVAGVYKGSLSGNTDKAKVYINGAQSAAAGNSGTILTSTYNFTTTPFCVGGRESSATASYNFDGLIDEVRVYSRAFTADDVAALYAWTGDTSSMAAIANHYARLRG